MQKRRRRRVPRQKARDDGTGKEEFVVEIKVGILTSDVDVGSEAATIQ